MSLFKWKRDKKPIFPNIVEKFFGKKITDNISSNEEVATVPSVNISDNNKVFEVNIAVPGLKKKDIKIEVQNNCLVISSEKQYKNEEKTKNWVRKEYGYASFQRIFQLPENANPDKIKAKMKKGVLQITVGKNKNKNSKILNVPVQ
ncbi:MAG: Hsp20/alpha crystallin family protein [Bacteroidales bacterium]|nr:Hsp20/alpha crystallin family protein [Bacteroidales bacterium]